MNPHRDAADLKMKMEKDVGIWITWVDEDDGVINFDFPNDANFISQRSDKWNHIRITSGSGEHLRCFLNGVESTTGAVVGTKGYGIEDIRTSNSVHLMKWLYSIEWFLIQK